MIDRIRLIRELSRIVGPDGVLDKPADRLVYECDGYTVDRSIPEIVVLPDSTRQVSEVVRLLHSASAPMVPRGAGTGLAGGCLPLFNGVMIVLTRMNRVLSVDYRNRKAVIEAGLVNSRLTDAVAAHGYHFAPDPSSQGCCTIGGNIANNSGGPHTLKYGVTTDHILAVELVLPDGSVIWTGSGVEEAPGYDLTGVVVGSEGTFGIVTRAIVRITRNPKSFRTLLAIFDSIDDATHAVSSIISRGILPAALEMMDNLVIQAVEAAFHYGFPLDAQAVLIIELDGPGPGLDDQADEAIEVCQHHHAREVRQARTPEDRQALWTSRKRGIGALGRLAPSVCTQDGVIPRTRLPEVLRRIAEIGKHYNLRIANVFHAGDGNLHPIILFDERDEEETRRVLKAGGEILAVCASVGGSITGEHGIGIEKLDYMPLIFSPADIQLMAAVRDVFNPSGLCNPGKVIPGGAPSCIDWIKPARRIAV